MASKTARRDGGSGALYQDSRGLWTAAIALPPGPNGERRRKVIRAKSRAAANDKLRRLRAELDKTGDLPTSSPTLEQWMTQWLDRIAAARLKPRTIDGYRGYSRRYIVPILGKRRLDQLTPANIRQMHDTITGQGLSATTALQAHRILSKALVDAMREGRVTRNVATLLDAPRRASTERQALTVEQAITLLRSVADHPYGGRWALGLLTGMRQGECLGLTRQAIDLEQGVITVEWALHRLRWQHGCDGACSYQRAGFCPQRRVEIPDWQESRQVRDALWLLRPKSRRSWRRVVMAPMLHEILRRHIDTADPTDLLWGAVDPSDDHQAWTDALAAAGLPHVPMHSLRHTTATLLYALGVPEQTRMEILGHSSATTTAGYTHIDITMQRDAMALLDGLLHATGDEPPAIAAAD